MATISSIKVSSRSSRRDRDQPGRLVFNVDTSSGDLHLVEDAVHRGDQRDGDEPDDQAHDDDDGRLEERGQLLDLVVELGLVVLAR